MKRAVAFVWIVAALAFLSCCVDDSTPNNGVPQPEDDDAGNVSDENTNNGGGNGDPEPGEEGYKIRPGDILDVDGGRFPELNKQVRVDDKGYVKLVYIDRVKVGGKTKWEVEDLLSVKYKPYIKSVQVTVEVLNLKFFVGGEVRNGGQKAISGKITLTQAIQIAGDYTTWANKKAVTIRRVNEDGEVEVLKFDCEKIEKGDAEDPLVKPDDIITVPRGGMF
jgi:protein involved in polysaccharide export with SLBB domain